MHYNTNDDAVAAIVLAAGAGTRFGGPKQFARAGAIRLVDRAVRAVSEVAGTVVVVVPPGVEWAGDGIGAVGGASRAESMRRGLAHVPAAAEIVVVHDAAHPLAGADLVAAVVREVRSGADGAVPVLSIRETVAYAEGATLGRAVPRRGLVLVQMPHAFRASLLRAAHASPSDATDDATLLQERGHRIVTVDGDPRNIHVTTPAELALLSELVDDDPRLR
jgi:2-C-methyl-D-erythritol 4-phosphate cytidylyltransferase